MRIRTLLPLVALFTLTLSPMWAQAPAQKTMTFPQLIATRYPTGATLPAEGMPPAPTYDFVDRTKLPTGAKLLSAAQTKSGAIWVLTDHGTFRAEGGKYVPFDLPLTFKPHQPQVHADTQLKQLTSDGVGYIWAATSHGLLATDGDNLWQIINQQDGMPYIEMNCVYLAPNGDIWGGTDEGAWRLRDGIFRYFWGKRYMPGNKVSRIWGDATGRIWLLTDGGTGCIAEKAMTLKEKAAHFEEITTTRHDRRGFIGGSALKVPGEPEKGVILDASDNDGLWTAMYVGAESLRYAATKDPKAKERAKRGMDALLELERLTGIPGYPARSYVTDEELKAGVLGFDANETVRVPGEDTKIWFRSPVEKNIWCKGDTSSDEIDGHYFAWLLYYDHVADAEEKKRVAATVRRVTDYIIKNDYTLIGHGGKKTRWGVWHPKYINEDPRWYEERGLNSIELLTFLKVAAHICQEKKYEDAYNDLIVNHHYLLNTLLYRKNAPWYGINHSDDELAYVCYYPLLLLEKDPARRRVLVRSIAQTWEDHPELQTIRSEKSPLYNFMYGGVTGNPCAPDDAIQALHEWPWDLTNHTVRNSHRHDITLRSNPLERNQNQADRVLPLSERRVMRWNGDPFRPDNGGDSRSEEDGTAFLLPYWLGVYHGYIGKED